MNCFATATALAAIDNALASGSVEASVLALRAVDAAPDHARRIAADRVDAHLRLNRDERKEAIAGLLIALRRAGV